MSQKIDHIHLSLGIYPVTNVASAKKKLKGFIRKLLTWGYATTGFWSYCAGWLLLAAWEAVL